jgi:hypothetical protein
MGMATSFMAKHLSIERQGQNGSFKAKFTASTTECLTRQFFILKGGFNTDEMLTERNFYISRLVNLLRCF